MCFYLVIINQTMPEMSGKLMARELLALRPGQATDIRGLFPP